MAELRKRDARPKPDAQDADGTPGLSRDAVRGWISRLEASVERKAAAGLSIADVLERCRNASTPTG